MTVPNKQMIAVLKLVAEVEDADASVWVHLLKNGEPYLCVNCSDLFYYASADAEDVPWEKLDEFLACHKADPDCGIFKWAMAQRGEEVLKQRRARLGTLEQARLFVTRSVLHANP